MMKVFISGKVSGDTNYKEKFQNAQMELEKRGCVVLSPAMLPLDYLTKAEASRIELAMIDTADAIMMLPDWEQSNGACIERDLCVRLGKSIYYYDELVSSHGDS